MSPSYADRPWIERYDDFVSPRIEIPDYPLHHLLEESARNRPNNTAIIYQGNKIKYEELNELANRVAAALTASGFKKGDRAVIYMANLPQFVITFFGILKAGGIVIATNPLYSKRELEHQLADCGAATVFVMSRYYKLLKEVQRKGNTNVRRVIVTNLKEFLPRVKRTLFTLLRESKGGDRVNLEPGDTWFQDFLSLGKRSSKSNVDVSPDDPALLQYTGGTTGIAKGAVALHRNLAANTSQLQQWIPEKYGEEVFISAIPFFHSYGMITAMAFPIAIAAVMIVIPDPRNLPEVLNSIQKLKATFFPGVPTLYVAINNHRDVLDGKYDLTSIEACVSGSAPLLVETKTRFEKLTGGKLVEGYGLTEAHVVTHANPLFGGNPPGSIGLPIPEIECRIMDTISGEQEMPVGELGELVIRGPNIMTGYWNMPEETVTALRDGWLFTGDIARMDEEGYFYIEDRKKDLIIAGGYNIYPREVEDVLMTHESIVEVAVAGVSHPERGETVKAWIVKKEDDPTTEEQIITWSKDHLAKYKYPRIIEFRDALPKTIVGKVLKRELVKEYEDSVAVRKANRS